MLPGTYVMIGGGFSVTGTASITSVSSQGDGVIDLQLGRGRGVLGELPVGRLPHPLPCHLPALSAGSTCLATASSVLNPPADRAIQAGNPVTYKLTLPKGTFAGAPGPTGTAGRPSPSTTADIRSRARAEWWSPRRRPTTSLPPARRRYTTFGRKGITAVYAGDVIYTPTGATNSPGRQPPRQPQDRTTLT